mmetsp:Transcript_13610/g.34448  ORF Transcript_13610/g.34448 Transcript_13610/m.34448 type:complete len:428 (-) Transcript_13610:30-1313(-)
MGVDLCLGALVLAREQLVEAAELHRLLACIEASNEGTVPGGVCRLRLGLASWFCRHRWCRTRISTRRGAASNVSGGRSIGWGGNLSFSSKFFFGCLLFLALALALFVLFGRWRRWRLPPDARRWRKSVVETKHAMHMHRQHAWQHRVHWPRSHKARKHARKERRNLLALCLPPRLCAPGRAAPALKALATCSSLLMPPVVFLLLFAVLSQPLFRLQFAYSLNLRDIRPFVASLGINLGTFFGPTFLTLLAVLFIAPLLLLPFLATNIWLLLLVGNPFVCCLALIVRCHFGLLRFTCLVCGARPALGFSTPAVSHALPASLPDLCSLVIGGGFTNLVALTCLILLLFCVLQSFPSLARLPTPLALGAHRARGLLLLGSIFGGFGGRAGRSLICHVLRFVLFLIRRSCLCPTGLRQSRLWPRGIRTRAS